MTVFEVKFAVQEIRQEAEKGEGPRAHIADDKLRERVLFAIAIGETDNPAALALAALETTTIEFDRWYE